MLLNPSIRPYVQQLDNIEHSNRRRFKACRPFLLYQHLISYCSYWRALESHKFHGLDSDAQDELYFHINKKLHSIFELELDLYWLIQGYDGKLLYPDGRQPFGFYSPRPFIPQYA